MGHLARLRPEPAAAQDEVCEGLRVQEAEVSLGDAMLDLAHRPVSGL